MSKTDKKTGVCLEFYVPFQLVPLFDDAFYLALRHLTVDSNCHSESLPLLWLQLHTPHTHSFLLGQGKVDLVQLKTVLLWIVVLERRSTRLGMQTTGLALDTLV